MTASKMSCQLSLLDIDTPISLPVSGDGHSPSNLPDGRQASTHGPDPAHASLSPRQAKELGLLTHATSGRRGIGTSASVSLTSSLASKLQALTAMLGSTLFKMAWKTQVTPSGRQLPLLRATARRTPVTEFTLPLSSWVTTSARDWKDTPGMATVRPDGRSRIDQLPRQALLASWPTTTAEDGNRGSKPPRPHDTGVPLSQMVALLGPCPARLTASGNLLIGSAAGVTSGGPLNPEHSRWLTGFPEEWGSCGATAMQSLSRKRSRSSKR